MNLTLSLNCSKLGVDDAAVLDVAVLDVQNSVVVISPVQVVVGDLHWSVLEVHVQDVDAAPHVLVIKLALKIWFLLPMCCTTGMHDRAHWHSCVWWVHGASMLS